MDFISFQSAMTVIVFVSFIGIVIWAFSSRHRAEFDAAANIPFEEDDANPDQPAPGDQHG